MGALAQWVRDTARLLTFRLSVPQLGEFGNGHLAFGMFFAWMAGIGRYWDSPKASLGQHLGLGSVVYVICLALFLYLLIAPLKPENWTYKRVLTFVSLTSPPAILYAIPVEQFMSLDAASQVNMWFLAVVATWRVALLFWFLSRFGGLRWWEVIFSSFLPLTVIVIALTMLNLQHVVFNIMSGIRPEDRSVHDAAYSVVFFLSWLSIMTGPFFLVGYLVALFKRRRGTDETNQ